MRVIEILVNDNLEQQAVALFKSWFIDFSLFGGTVPENWEDTTLENITTLITRGIAPKYSDNSDQTVVNQKCIRNHTIDLSLARTHTPKAINEKWLKFGDLLINSTGDGTLGRVAQVWFAPKALTVDSHVTIVLLIFLCLIDTRSLRSERSGLYNSMTILQSCYR